MTFGRKNKHLNFLIKFICSIFLGLILSFFVIQNSCSFKNILQQYIVDSWESDFDCKFDCKISSINFFSPKISFEYVRMKSFDSSWSWECKPIEIGFSWIDLFLSGVIDINIDVHSGIMNSLVSKNELAVWENIESILNGVSWSIPTILKCFSIKNGLISIKEKNENYESILKFSSVTKNISGNYKTKISFAGGKLSAYSKSLLDNLSGFVSFNIVPKSGNIYFYADSKCLVDVQFLKGNKTCFITGKWFYDQGIFDVISQDKTFSISPIKFYFLGDTLFAESNLESSLEDIAGLFFQKSGDLSGKCAIQFRSESGPIGFGLSGTLTLSDVAYKDFDCFSLGNVSFKKRKDSYKGFLSCIRKDGLIFSGDVSCDSNFNKMRCNITNNADIKIAHLPYWKVSGKKVRLSLSYNCLDRLTGRCCCLATSEQLGANIDITGDIDFSPELLSLAGNINNRKYKLGIYLEPRISLKHLVYKDEFSKPLFSINSLQNDKNKFLGYIKFPFIRLLVKDNFDYDIQGEGDCNIYGVFKENLFLCKLNFRNGSVSFPNFYNFLNSFEVSCKVDLSNNIIIAKNSVVNFHKGVVNCKKAVLYYDEEFKPTYINVPLIFNNCFVNLESDLFALVSGRMLFSKCESCFSKLEGLAIIERSNLRKNIFSSDVSKKYSKSNQSDLFSYLQNMDCDFSIITKEPMCVNTSFLKTSATVDLSIKNKILVPQISGKIDFLSGSLSFPYKPLYISKGSIYFLPHQSDDPIVELVARNKINKYNVAMYVSGSFANQQISFDSSPSLVEEQIVALLIAGSAQESLNVVAPALIMQTVKDSLFGSEKSEQGRRNYLSRFLEPFKKVRVVPSFIDQTGRGGLRGSLEVDLSDRLRALVQKNFSLSEDTRFELEYLLSDDVSVRGLRRENGDIGGEVEMRWKF